MQEPATSYGYFRKIIEIPKYKKKKKNIQFKTQI